MGISMVRYRVYVPKCGIARSYGTFFLVFLRNLQSDFQHSHTSSHSHAQCVRAAFLHIHTSVSPLVPQVLKTDTAIPAEMAAW